jgi:hypothetical protein
LVAQEKNKLLTQRAIKRIDVERASENLCAFGLWKVNYDLIFAQIEAISISECKQGQFLIACVSPNSTLPST